MRKPISGRALTLPRRSMLTRNKLSQKISGAVLIGAFLFVNAAPGYALRATQPVVGAGAEELKTRLTGPPSTGLEEIPFEADPRSASYAPIRFRQDSPVTSSPNSVVIMQRESLDPKAVVDAVKAGKQVHIRSRVNRVGQTALWKNEANAEELKILYGLAYDIMDGQTSFDLAAIARIIQGLHHQNQSVAAAARDVIVHARIYEQTDFLKRILDANDQWAGSVGPYAAYYLKDALTTRVDWVHRLEYGSPETAIFAGEMTAERRARLQKQLLTFVTPGTKLAALSGSGQRMGATIGEVEAGLTIDSSTQRPVGFLSDQILVDPGSQPHDVVKLLFALVAKLFVEQMPKWREDPDLGGKPGAMPEQWTVGIGMDPRRSGAAVFQTVARIFEKKGVHMVFTGITSAPEAAARALLSDSDERMLGFFEITPSHIPEGNSGTKLMLWLGQILPWAKAEQFNELIRQAAADPAIVNEVIDMLMDPSTNAAVDKLIQTLPQGYAGSRQRYHHYLQQLFTGNFTEGPGAAASLAQSWNELRTDLTGKGFVVVPILDINGGARIPDLPLFADLTPGLVAMGVRASEFAHALPPGEVASRPLQEVATALASLFEQQGMVPIFVGPDPDGDRKAVIMRNPKTGAFEYLDPQAGFLLDVLGVVTAAREAGIPGVGVVGNGPTTVVAETLAGRLGYEFRTAETGEANVVMAMNRQLADLEQKYGKGNAAVVGGEGSAAASILGKVQVRDMAQAFGSLFLFLRDSQRVHGLVDKLIDNGDERNRLHQEINDVWYQPNQLQYLLWRIVNELLPPMLNTDPGFKLETHMGDGLGAGDRQKMYKDTADRLLAPESDWVRRIQEITAFQIQQATGEPVSPEQITVSPPINNIEAYQLTGAGNRTVPDGTNRVIHDGGYEIHISYTPNAGSRYGDVGKSYYLYKLWLRGSKTEVGVTRRLFLGTAEFLPRAMAEPFLRNLLDQIYPTWLVFLNALEAHELEGHLEGRFPVEDLRDAFRAEVARREIPDTETGLRTEVLNRLNGGLASLLNGTPAIRATNVANFGTPASAKYNETDARLLNWQDERSAAALAALRYGLDQISEPAHELQRIAASAGSVAALPVTEIATLSHRIRSALAVRVVPSADNREGIVALMPNGKPLPSGETGAVLSQELVFQSLDWKFDRLLRGLNSSANQASDPATRERFVAGIGHIVRVIEELHVFAQRGNAQENSENGIAHANLITDKIILAGEQVPVAAGQEEVPLSPITGHRLEETGIPGYRRVVYNSQDGSSWQGGVVRSDVPENAIAPTAYLAPYSFAEGASTRLEKGAQVTAGSTVSNSVVRSDAQLRGSVAESALIHPSAWVSYSALGPAFEDDSWSYSPSTENNPALSVRNHSVNFGGNGYRVEIGTRSSVRGSVFQDSVVGPDSEISGSALVISGWGEQTRMDGGVKSWLAVGAQGHADIAGVQHRPDGTEVPAALELAEMAYQGLPPDQYSGKQIRAHYVGYTEAVVTNSVPLVDYDAGELTVTPYPVPPLTLFGDYTIFSIFAGSPNPQGIKTDGQPTPGVITRLTGGPGEQSSQHGRIVAEPLSILSGFSNVIGRLLGFPELDNPLAVITEPEVTHLGALSAVGADAQLGLNGLEGWGQILPAEARGQLSRGSGIAPWVFLYSPETLFSLMGQLASGLPAGDESRYDDLPQRLLKSGLALSRWMLDQEKAKVRQANAQVVERLERYIAGYAALIDSGAWTGTWVQDGEELRHPEHWRFNNGRWETDFLDLERMHQLIHPFASATPYEQVSLKQLLEVPPGVDRPDWSEWTGYYLKPEDLQTDSPTPLDQLQSVDESLKQWRIIGQDDKFYYTVEGGRIGRKVQLSMIHPSALIGPGTVLTGATTSVGEGTRLLRVIAHQSVIGKQTQLTAVRAERMVIGARVKLTWAKLGGTVPSRIGSGTVGSYVGVSKGSVVGENNTFEPFALVINSTTGPNNVIGISLVNSTVQSGFMGRHLSTAVHHLKQLPVRFEVNGKPYDLAAASLNVAGGLFIHGRTDAPVELSAAYPLSLTTIDPGQGQNAEVGAFSVLKNKIMLDDGEILPFTFHAFNHLPSTDPRFAVPGRHNDSIGGALEFPGIFLRNFIYRTKKGIRDDLIAQGVSPEQIAVHPRMLQSDYMIEATIVNALEQVLNQLREIDPAAYGHLVGTSGLSALTRLVQSVNSDLAQIEQPEQSSLGRRSGELRDQINTAIKQVQEALPDLPGTRPAKVSSSGHTAAQLLEGVARLSQNLDGRWRMRNQTFTEVEWRYQAYDASRRARDTWVPVAKPDSSPIPLPAGALSEGKYLFIGPEAAVPALWAGLHRLQPSAGETIRLVVFGRDTNHLETIRSQMAGYSFVSSAEFVDISQYGGWLGAVSAQVSVLGIGEHEDAFEYRLIRSLNDLGVLAKFLQIPDVSFRAWEQQIQATGLEENV